MRQLFRLAMLAVVSVAGGLTGCSADAGPEGAAGSTSELGAPAPPQIVFYGKTNNCDPSLVRATIAPSTSCETLADNVESWSVKIDGRCMDTPNGLGGAFTTLRGACYYAQPEKGAMYYGTYCDVGTLIASVEPSTDCDQVVESSTDPRSVRVNGECVDVNGIDTLSAAKTCHVMKKDRNVIYDWVDCKVDDVVAVVDEDTDCEQFGSSGSASSLLIDGQCVRPWGAPTYRQACLHMKSKGAVLYGTTDSCDASYVESVLTETTDCSRFSDTDGAWSVKVNGQCVDLEDTNLRRVCELYKPGTVAIFGSTDRCASDKLITRIDASTDCDSLSGSDDAWSVLVDGVCIDIGDTNARDACRDHRP